MNFLQKISNRVNSATKATRQELGKIPFDPKIPNPIRSYLSRSGVQENQAVVTDWEGDRAYREGMKKSHWVYRCVRFLSDTMSSVPIFAQTRQRDGRWVDAHQHPLSLLLKQPNAHHNSKFFVEHLIQNLNLAGNALWEKVRSRDKRRAVINLWPVHPDAIKPVPDTDQFIKYYTYSTFAQGGRAEGGIPVEDMIHIMFQNPMNPYWGIGPLEPVGRVVDTEVQAMLWWKLSLARMAVKDGIMTLKEPLPLEQWNEYREMINEEIVGARSSHGVVLIGEEASYTPISSTAKELDWIDSRKLSREDIAAAFGVPPILVNILDRATYCMPADTQVSTASGPKSIADIEVGDRVWSWDGKGVVLKPVAWSGRTGVECVYKIRTTTREFRCTGTHPVLVAKDEKRQVFKGYKWVKAQDLKAGNIIVAATSRPEYGTWSCPTRDIVTEGFMEFCGLYVGDGCRSCGNSKQVRIARCSTAPYMDHYRNVMKAEFEKYYKGNRHQTNRQTTSIKIREYERVTCFNSASAVDELEALGLCGTAHTKQVPPWVFELTPELRSAFLRGFVDADGSVDNRGHIAIHSANLTLLTQIRELAMSVGVPVCNIRSSSQWVTLPNGDDFFSTMHTFKCASPEHNLALIGSNDPKAVVRMQKGKKWCDTGRAYHYPDYKGRVTAPPQHCTFSKIVEISKSEVQVPVYDISVPGTNNFIANGVVVHNSNFEQAQVHYWSNVAVPCLELLRQALNSSLVYEFGDPDKLRVWFDLEKVPALRYDLDKKVKIMKDLFYIGTPLKIAADVVGLELPRFKGDETSYIASNLLPVDAYDAEIDTARALQVSPVKPEDQNKFLEFKSNLLKGLPPF